MQTLPEKLYGWFNDRVLRRVLRNSTYLNHHYGRNWAVRYLRGLFTLLGYLFTILFTAPVSRAYRWRDALPLIRAYQSGIREELGIIHF